MNPAEMEWILRLSSAQFLDYCLKAPAPRRRTLMKTRCAIDLRLFAEWFFPHHCRLAFSPFHEELLNTHLAPGVLPERAGRRRAIAAPRGAGKSALCALILLIHDILYKNERYIVLLSATLRQAARRLRNLRLELETNERLRAVFPRELERRGELRAHALRVNGVQLDVHGSGAEIRGVTSGPWRPTKILLDDVEDSEAVESPAQREKLADWFHEVIENLGDTYSQILVLGTLLHPESLLAGLLRRPDYEARLYRSVEAFSPREDLWAEWRRLYINLADPRRAATARRFFAAHREEMLEGTRVLWPAKEDYYELMTQLAARGRRAFYQEKQNEPLASAASLFDPAALTRFSREGRALRMRAGGAAREVPLESLRVFGFLDPAMGKSARSSGRAGDFAALATLGAAPDGSLYALELWVRRAPPLEQIRAVFDAHERWRFQRLGVEGNLFQELLRLPLEQERERRRAEGRAWDLPFEMIPSRRSKVERIAALEPLAANGWLAFSDTLPEEFWRELQAFPRGDHDDALDALEGAVSLARRFAASAARPALAPRGAGPPPARALREY